MYVVKCSFYVVFILPFLLIDNKLIQKCSYVVRIHDFFLKKFCLGEESRDKKCEISVKPSKV